MIQTFQHALGTVVQIDRADKANALTEQMLMDMTDAVQNADPTSPLVLTGVGRVFSAGADLDAVKAGLATSPAWEALSGAIVAHAGLTVAALNGSVAGGAMGMVLACDLRLTASHAKFFYPVARLGILPQPSDPKRLSALIGPSRAKQILLLGRKIDADTAEHWGLIDGQLPGGDVLQGCADVLSQAIGAKSGHIAAIKTLF